MKKRIIAIANRFLNSLLNRKKELYILRGIPGCGKSTVAENIGGIICCADDYFMRDGIYQFNAAMLGNAHSYCKWKFHDAMDTHSPRIVIANTNTTANDVSYYRNAAIERGYKVFVIVVENWHDGNDVHNVPLEKKESMATALAKSIKLLPTSTDKK